MKQELYACVCAGQFPTQAFLRLRPDLRSSPVAVLDGRSPQETVCSLNRNALQRDAGISMSRLEAEEIREMVLLQRSQPMELSARNALLECVSKFSPRIEDCSLDALCIFVLDIAGSERLFGAPEHLAQRMRKQLSDAGFHASIVISRNFEACCMKAKHIRGISVIPPGKEAESLAKLPISALDLEADQVETFALWGIRTLGELAELPEEDLVIRFGARAQRWIHLARGDHDHLTRPIEPPLDLHEYCEFEAPVEQIESLLFIGARMLECLTHRAASHALCLSSVSIKLLLEKNAEHVLQIKPALPTIDHKFLLKLMQLEIAAHPPASSVVALDVSAIPGFSTKVQLGLFNPPVPEPSRMDVTLARLKALVGEDRVGSPVLEDSHQSGRFAVSSFCVAGASQAKEDVEPRMVTALRRMRPSVPLDVTLKANTPERFRDKTNLYLVESAYGPWRSTGSWWSADGWATEEWDVLATNNDGVKVNCLLVHDALNHQWRLEALYD